MTQALSPGVGTFPHLAMCFDGTWNTYQSRTNVSRIFEAIADANCGCRHQIKFYDEGVGTTLGTKVRGGLFGVGLSADILAGYAWLINHYVPGDLSPEADDPSGELFSEGSAIYLFGFSRGAYTARSLAGLVNRCGILKRSLFRGVPATVESELIQKAWELYRRVDFEDSPAEPRLSEECSAFRMSYAHTVRIKLVGVWDTVGALGVPRFISPVPLGKTIYGFHDTTLGRVVENARHAIAIDEHREDYACSMWTRRHRFTRSLEQRWFPGAHANVGGGYEDDTLPEPPLLWMTKEAGLLGLEFRREALEVMEQQLAKPCSSAPPAAFALDGTEFLAPIRDSYGEFLWGIYGTLKTIFQTGRYYRQMLIEVDDPRTNRGFGPDQTIDTTVFQKLAADPDYRPPNVAKSG
jgi:uncharacterized protein (DUF2235 family)